MKATCPFCGFELEGDDTSYVYHPVSGDGMMFSQRGCPLAGYGFRAEEWARRPAADSRGEHVAGTAPAPTNGEHDATGGTSGAGCVTTAEAAYLLGVCYDANDERDPIIKRIANKLGLGAAE